MGVKTSRLWGEGTGAATPTCPWWDPPDAGGGQCQTMGVRWMLKEAL